MQALLRCHRHKHNKPGSVVRRAFVALSIAVGCVSSVAGAQQAIINLPSADQTPRGKQFFMHETQLAGTNPTAWAMTHFYTYGVTDRFELAATLYNLRTPRSDNTTLGLGFKGAQRLLTKRFPGREVQFTYGYMLPVSLQGRGVGTWAYSHLSARLPVLETRITAGGGYATRQVLDKDAWTVLGGIEQPLPHHFVLVMEWFSGRHNSSNLIPGLLYHSKNWIFVAGYKFPNDPVERHGLVLEVGRFW
jgi:hypothetical protein